LRIAHLTTVDMSLALLLGTELEVDLAAGHAVFGLSAPGPYVAEVQRLGVQHVPVPSLTRAPDLRSDVLAAGQLFGALRRLEPDVLHTHNPKTGVLGRVLGRLAGVPVVVNTCHGLWAGPDHRPLQRALVNAIEGTASRFSHFELFQNAADRHTLRWAVPDHKARVVGNGVDLRRFRFDPEGREAVRRDLGVEDGDLLVGGVGRLVAEKGIFEYAEAARRLRGKARFAWVGPADPEKRDWVDPAELELEVLGSRSDMPAVYSAFDLFVLPSHREGFSRSAMEAAACARPMVLTDIRGCREIGDDGGHLLLVPPGDVDALTGAVARLLADDGLRSRLGSSAAARASATFDQRAVAEASLDTYRLVAARKGLDW